MLTDVVPQNWFHIALYTGSWTDLLYTPSLAAMPEKLKQLQTEGDNPLFLMHRPPHAQVRIVPMAWLPVEHSMQIPVQCTSCLQVSTGMRIPSLITSLPSICMSLRLHVIPGTPDDGCLQAIPFALLYEDFGYFHDIQAGLHGTPDPMDYQFAVSH